MATVLSGASVRFNLNATETTAVGAGNRVMQFASPAGIYTDTLANGTSSAQANCIASIVGTLTSGTPADINLRTLTLAGVDDPLTLTGIKSLLIQETTDPIGTNYLLVGDSSGTLTNAITAFWSVASGQQKIGSGGAWGTQNPLGFTVDASHYVLRLNANTGTVIYQIDLIGTK